MKSISPFISIFITLLTCTFAFAQDKAGTEEHTISIKDIRQQGVKTENSIRDRSTTGHKEGDAAVTRFLQRVHTRTKDQIDKYDTIPMYEIHFYKTYNSVVDKGTSWLEVYNAGVRDTSEYDTASYTWIDKDIISVTLLNSKTNTKKNVKLKAEGQQAVYVSIPEK